MEFDPSIQTITKTEDLQLARVRQEEEVRRFRRELLAPDDASALDRDVR